MEKEKKDALIKNIKEQFNSTSISEHFINIFKAGLASLPIASAFASLLSDYIPSSKFKRLEDFAKQIAEDLKRLSDRIETDYITSDEFAYMFEQSFRGVAQNIHKEKIEAFRGILLNSAIQKDIVQEEKEFFLSLVDNLSIVHIKILKFMAFPNEYINELGLTPQEIRGGFRGIFRTIMPEFSNDTSIVELAFGDLFQKDLISTDKSIFHTMAASQGLSLVGNRVTDLGRRFIEFCKTP